MSGYPMPTAPWMGTLDGRTTVAQGNEWWRTPDPEVLVIDEADGRAFHRLVPASEAHKYKRVDPDLNKAR